MVSLGGSVCTSCFIVVFVCVGCCRWGICALMSHCVCVYQKVRVRLVLIIECVSVCRFSCSLSLYVLVWYVAATVISGLLRHSSSSAPDQFSCVCQIAWHGTAQLSSTQLGPTQMKKTLCHSNFDFVLASFSFSLLNFLALSTSPLQCLIDCRNQDLIQIVNLNLSFNLFFIEVRQENLFLTKITHLNNRATYSEFCLSIRFPLTFY